MVANRKVTGKSMTMPAGIGLGVLVSLIVTLVGSGVVAWLINKEVLAQESVGYGSIIILLMASAIGAIIAAAKIKHQRLIVCGISGLLYYLLLILMTAVFFGGQYDAMGVTAIVILIGCLAAAFLGLNRDRQGNKRIKKMRSR